MKIRMEITMQVVKEYNIEDEETIQAFRRVSSDRDPSDADIKLWDETKMLSQQDVIIKMRSVGLDPRTVQTNFFVKPKGEV